MKRLYFLLILFFCATTLLAQENTSSKNKVWWRIESPKRDFSISFPPNPIINHEGKGYEIYSQENGNKFHISIEEDSRAKIAFQNSFAYLKDTKNYVFFKLKDFIGAEYKAEKTVNEEYVY